MNMAEVPEIAEGGGPGGVGGGGRGEDHQDHWPEGRDHGPRLQPGGTGVGTTYRSRTGEGIVIP
jgi:hypothetical protein